MVTAVQTSNPTIFITVNVPAKGDQDPYITIFWVMASFNLVGQSQSFVQNKNFNCIFMFLQNSSLSKQHPFNNR